VQNMMKHPLITINPDMNAISRLGDVVFPTQWCGIEYEGTAYRMDSVPITLKQVVKAPPGVLTDEELLTKILAEVRAIKAKKGEAQPKAEPKAETAKAKSAAKPAKAPAKKKTKKKKAA
jgi:formylmethanofuran dehydrogenase subunit B